MGETENPSTISDSVRVHWLQTQDDIPNDPKIKFPSTSMMCIPLNIVGMKHVANFGKDGPANPDDLSNKFLNIFLEMRAISFKQT